MIDFYIATKHMIQQQNFFLIFNFCILRIFNCILAGGTLITIITIIYYLFL